MSGCYPYNCDCNEALANSITELRNRINELEKLDILHFELMFKSNLERIEKLEKLNQQCFDANPIGEIDNKFKSIYKCLSDNESRWIFIKAKFDEIDKLKREFADFMQKSSLNCKNQPFKCPVCDGIGVNCIIGEVRGLPIKTDKCNSCQGKGIVWG